MSFLPGNEAWGPGCQHHWRWAELLAFPIAGWLGTATPPQTVSESQHPWPQDFGTPSSPYGSSEVRYMMSLEAPLLLGDSRDSVTNLGFGIPRDI